MKIALHDNDKTNFPNLALMKLSAFYKASGNEITWYVPIFSQFYDAIYSSKVFTFTQKDSLFGTVYKGGTGYKLFNELPQDIEHICPDYTLYPKFESALGFLTRGCPNKCKWCVVPKKEGNIRPNADIEEFLDGRKSAVLLDNNVLASEYGLAQIEKISKLKIKIDFNQGLDARLIDNSVAKLLSKVKWLKPVRLACDTKSQMDSIFKAVQLLRWNNVHPSTYFVYVLVRDVSDALERVKFLKGLQLDPFAQPYIDFENSTKPTKEQRNFARWVNHKAIFKTVDWKDYKSGTKNTICT